MIPPPLAFASITRQCHFRLVCVLCAIWLLGGGWHACSAAKGAPPEPVDCVNPLSGTNGDGNFSRGNTLPAIVLPFGMTTWAPQTDGSTSSFYTMKEKQFEGLRATHQPSIWIRDYGDFTVMPVVGGTEGSSRELASAFTHEKEKALPYYYSVDLDRYQTRAELAPTERCAAMRFTFPDTEAAALVFRNPRGELTAVADTGKQRVTGAARHVTFGAPGNFAMYFVAEFDQPFTTQEARVTKDERTLAVHFPGMKAGTPLTMRIGTSFISYEQAELNLRREVPDWNFDAVKERAKAAWTHALAVADIEGASDAQRSTFYTALYRALQFPRMFHEPDAQGKIQHYSPFDNGKLHDGPLYTDDGLWDTYRAAFPLLALLDPERDDDILRGWLNAYREGGWLPTWPSPGNRPCMIGSHGDAIFADAYTKGVRGYDAADAYAAARKDATQDGTGAWAGRDQLKPYIAKGFIGTDERKDGSAAVTLEYAYDDYCVSRLAKALGHEDDAKLFAERARNYQHVWDPESGFMRGRKADGAWAAPFDPIEWGGPYVEGNAWQWTWSVMQDPYGLMKLLGGREATARKLDTMLTMASNYKPGTYGAPIHEMRETEFARMGQYAHVNEPCHHMLYFYDYAGQPWKAQLYTRRVMDELYGSDGMVGDEDTGQMSAWYVFNAAGFYPFCPGNPIYLLGSPLFEKTTLHLAGGKTFTVQANGNSPANRYIQSARLNGQPFSRAWLPHEVVAGGGTLELQMGPQPNEHWGNAEADAPPNDLP